jgi:hypothetical protein
MRKVFRISYSANGKRGP